MVRGINKSRPPRAHHYRGITLVEIFVALGVLAILLSFAAAPLQRISARADVDIARENIVYALNVARRSAVRANVPVRVLLSENPSNNRLVAGFSPLRGSVDIYPLPNYALPEHVTVALSKELSTIEFLPTGRLAREGVITLSSETNPGYVIDIRVDDALTLRAPGSPPGRRAPQ